jgi:hypothetical protein
MTRCDDIKEPRAIFMIARTGRPSSELAAATSHGRAIAFDLRAA